jgi:hypothetical protein
MRTISIKLSAALLAGALSLAGGSALAQSSDSIDQATRGAAPSGQPTGPINIPAPPGPGDQYPGAPPVIAPAPSGPGGPASGPGGPAAGPAGGEEADATIAANYDATLQIYQSILDKEGSDASNIDLRIQSNEQMIAKYKPLLAQAESEQRRMQVDFMNRAFALKQQRESGQITEDAFAKAIGPEEAKFNRHRDEVAQDVSFYRDEIGQAEARLKDLKEQRKSMLDKAAREGRLPPPKKAPGEALFQGLSGTLDKLSAFHVHYTMDGVGRTQDFARNAPVVQK